MIKVLSFLVVLSRARLERSCCLILDKLCPYARYPEFSMRATNTNECAHKFLSFSGVCLVRPIRTRLQASFYCDLVYFLYFLIQKFNFYFVSICVFVM
uniref:Secreted protein n=1 Tax=Rhizophora mucronata TaxID=61149 RepID=A0A2P2KZL3_RHIMU